MSEEFDLAIVGSGAAAMAAAIRATAMGKSVVMIERGTFGGTCVNTGCVPSKALIAAAQAQHTVSDAGRFPGVGATAVPVDMAALAAGTRRLAESMRSEKYVAVADSYGWRRVQGAAAFAGTRAAPSLVITAPDGTTETIIARRYLVATGAQPSIPSIPGLNLVDYLTSTTAMELTAVPESLLVIGGGFIALEQAQLFARLGAKVTVLVRSRIASAEDADVADALLEALADEHIEVVQLATATSVDTEAGEVVVTASSPGGQGDFRAAKLLVATGRTPNTRGLNLETVGVDTSTSGAILVSNQLRTSNPRVWAAGDVTGHPEFVYVAAAQGTTVADNMFGQTPRSLDYTHLPRVMFTSPAIGSVGMTETQALASGIRYTSSLLPLTHVPRAQVDRDTRGFIKLIADSDSHRVLGISAVANSAGEIAAAGVYILEARMTVEQVARTWAPYLTMAEGIKIAAQSFSTDIAQLSCCAS